MVEQLKINIIDLKLKIIKFLILRRELIKCISPSLAQIFLRKLNKEYKKIEPEAVKLLDSNTLKSLINDPEVDKELLLKFINDNK